jgi:hypothetical protein
METTNRTDRDGNEVRRAEAIITVMDAYLASRSPEPGKSQLGEEYTAEYKTTEEIADELHSIMPIHPMEIVLYLQGEGYELKTAEDGTLRWEIWRDMHYML